MVLRNRKGYSCIGLEFSDVDLRLLKLYIVHHELVDYLGNPLSVRSFLYSLCKSWFIDDLYKFRDNNEIGDMSLLDDIDNTLDKLQIKEDNKNGE